MLQVDSVHPELTDSFTVVFLRSAEETRCWYCEGFCNIHCGGLPMKCHCLSTSLYLGITDWISGDQTVFNLQASTRVRILQSIHIVSQFHVHCPLHTLPRQLHEKCFQESGHGWSDVSPLVSYLWETATSDNVRKKLIKWINCALQSYGLALF